MCIFSFRGWLRWQEWVWNKEVNIFLNPLFFPIVQSQLLHERGVCEPARSPRWLRCHMWLQGGIWQLEAILWWGKRYKTQIFRWQLLVWTFPKLTTKFSFRKLEGTARLLLAPAQLRLIFYYFFWGGGLDNDYLFCVLPHFRQVQL